ncbi:hypothetical protein T05_2782 [Trichinella murrelli]|uniref:Uncharacterized protein n=1 Tax=Trichinella murrelli TaxID=144512 RepID=A0A0V0U905_9BILA|nr:hypothetical protein T05_2782 [Trichinella murrelli]
MKNQAAFDKLLYYKNKLQIAGFISFPIAQIKIAKYVTFLSISHQIRFCTTSDQVLEISTANKRGSSTSETPLKRIQDGNFFDIIMRYSLKFPSLVQYFLLLGNSIFLHFRAISNKLKKVVSIRVAMCIESSIC